MSSATTGSRSSRLSRLLAAGMVLLGLALVARPAADFVAGELAQRRTAGPTEPQSPGKPKVGDAAGKILIPRVGMALTVFEGVTDAVLKLGPGHIMSTAPLASGDGNCAIAGHRDSFFRKLAKAQRGDLVILESGARRRTYVLDQKSIVGPEQIDVLEQSGPARITLITCYPFGFVGSAPNRLIWTALPAPRGRRAASRQPAS
jgi:sortase A